MKLIIKGFIMLLSLIDKTKIVFLQPHLQIGPNNPAYLPAGIGMLLLRHSPETVSGVEIFNTNTIKKPLQKEKRLSSICFRHIRQAAVWRQSES